MLQLTYKSLPPPLKPLGVSMGIWLHDRAKCAVRAKNTVKKRVHRAFVQNMLCCTDFSAEFALWNPCLCISCKLSVQEIQCKFALLHAVRAWFFWISIVSCNCCAAVPILCTKLCCNQNFVQIPSGCANLIVFFSFCIIFSQKLFAVNDLSGSQWCNDV